MSDRSDRSRALAAALAVLAAGCGVALVRTVLTVPLRISLNYNEGWNAYHVAEVLRGGSPYHSASPFFFNNYPPLSFYLTAAATAAVGDPIVAGRWLSLAAFVVWAVLLARVAIVLGCRRANAWFGALLFAANLWLFTEYIGIDDPQMIGHAVQGVAVLLLLRSRRSTMALVWSAALCTIAIGIKQTLVAVPLASAIWLAFTDPPRAWRFIASCVAVGALASALVGVTLGAPALTAQVAARDYSSLKAAWVAVQWLARAIVLLAALGLLLRRRPRDPAALFCGVYASVAILVGVLLGGGVGVNWNVYFDAYWALCLSAAVAVERASDDGSILFMRRTPLTLALLVVPAIGLALAARPDWMTLAHWSAPHAADRADAAREIDWLASRRGPVLCEELALCFWAGKPVEVDVFSTQQRLRADPTLADRLVRRLDDRQFGAIQLDEPPRDLGAAFAAALERNYTEAIGGASRRFLIPR